MFEDFYFSPRQSGSQNKGGVIQLITDNQITLPHQSGYVGGVCSKTHSKSYCCRLIKKPCHKSFQFIMNVKSSWRGNKIPWTITCEGKPKKHCLMGNLALDQHYHSCTLGKARSNDPTADVLNFGSRALSSRPDWGHYCVLKQNTFLSQFLSPPRSITEYWQSVWEVWWSA